jgi:ribosomal protein L11 methylase PrmA
MMSEKQQYYQLSLVCSVAELGMHEAYVQSLDPLSLTVMPLSDHSVQIQALFFDVIETPDLDQVTWSLLTEEIWNQSDSVLINGLVLQCPKTVFGHGKHPTTQLCQEILAGVSLEPTMHLVDVGTGSGVLSFLAWQSGVTSIEAIDIDPFAIEISRQNARDNAIAEEMFSVADLFDWQPQRKADVLIANLPIDILEKAFDRLRDWVVLDGLMILSGLTTTWTEKLEALMIPSATILKKEQVDEWVCYLLRRTV